MLFCVAYVCFGGCDLFKDLALSLIVVVWFGLCCC